MVQVRIEGITGAIYPISVFIADYYGNNQTLIGTISSGPVPPQVDFNTSIPSLFYTAPQIMLILRDSAGCETFQLLDCTFGCTFQITIQEVNCVVDISIQESNCLVSISVDESQCGINFLSIT
jgi:hypothetical protein